MVKRRDILTVVVVVALLGGALAQGTPSRAASPAGPQGNAWDRFARQHHCFLAVEDAYSIKKRTYIGALPTAPQQGFKTIRAAMKFLQRKLPECAVWRDRINGGHVIHVVDAKALKWKANPLNQRLTFHGKMSLPQVASRIIQRKFPRVNVSCVGDQRYGSFPDVGAIAIRKAYEAPLRFDVRSMTLREFLTAGLVYNLKGAQLPEVLWRADYFLKGGKPTGRVDIMVYGVPVRAAPSATPTTHHSHTVK